MKKIQNVCWFSVLVFGLVLAACGFTYEEPSDIIDAGAPVIDTQPASKIIWLSDSTTDLLSVTAHSPDDGKLSYQWYTYTETIDYTNGTGTSVNGATNAAFSPNFTEDGTYRYYVVVTNTNNKASNRKTAARKSNPAIVTVNDPNNAQYPVISAQPQSTITYLDLTAIVTLSVTASVTDGGDLTYQWYSNTSATTTGGSEIAEAVEASYSPTISSADTYYYYVIVTNTRTEAPNRKEAPTPSEVATVQVQAVNITLTVHNSVDTWPNNYGFSTATDRYQYIRGVGGASNIEFRAGSGSASPNVSDDDLEKLFDPAPIVMSNGDGTGSYVSGGLGMNLLRICFYDDLDGIMDGTLKGTSAFAGGENSDYFSNIQVVNKHGGYVYATPWTLPAALKASSATGNSGGTLLGNQGQYARVDRFSQIADHFIDYMDKLWANDAPIFAMSLQNENNGDVGYEGTRYSGDNMAAIIKNHIGPKMRAPNTEPGRNVPGVGPQGIKGYGGGREWDQMWFAPGEHMGNPDQSDGARPTVNDADARKYIQWVGRHLYSGSGVSPYPTALGHGLEVWETEITDAGSYISPSYDIITQWRWVWHIPNMIYQTFALNDESSFYWWYFKRFYCMMGDGDRGTTNGELLNRGYAVSHFAKYAANSRRIRVSATGSYLQNQGSTTASSNDTSLPLTSTGSNPNFNPQVFAAWVANDSTGANSGANQPSTKIMAFQFPYDAATSADVESIVIIAFTPTRNAGDRGQDAGNIKINLPDGFAASSAELMRSNETVKHRMESVAMNEDGTVAVINLPRSNIVSVKFTR